tara:strand:+ start:961 stop:1746 length:786 start_codon:yes stop_codon:yes gene_type:complete
MQRGMLRGCRTITVLAICAVPVAAMMWFTVAETPSGPVDRVARFDSETGTYHRATERTIASIDGTGRSMLNCPAGNCVLFHFSSDDTGTIVSMGAPVDHVSFRELFSKKTTNISDSWLNGQENLETFNCHTYATGPAVGLTVRDWTHGDAHPLTGFSNPMGVILSSYFEQLGNETANHDGLRRIEMDDSLRTDDIICFVDQGETTRFVHSGRIRKQDGRNWIVSKFGSRPLLLSRLAPTFAVYAKEVNEVRTYRLRQPLDP